MVHRSPSLLAVADTGRQPALPSGLRTAAPVTSRSTPVLQLQRAPSQLSLFPPPGLLRSSR